MICYIYNLKLLWYIKINISTLIPLLLKNDDKTVYLFFFNPGKINIKKIISIKLKIYIYF